MRVETLDTNHFTFCGQTAYFEVAIDEESKAIHILDIGRYATSVTNTMSGEFCLWLTEQYISYEVGAAFEWRFLCYGTDCIVSEFLPLAKGQKFIPHRAHDHHMAGSKFSEIPLYDPFFWRMHRIWATEREY